MRELVLVRHGFAGSNRDGIASCAVPGEGLTDEGREQARALGRVLAAEEIGVALTSRLARTQETLALAVDGRSVPVVVHADLDEIHFGAFDGGSLETYRAWAATHPPDVPPPGAGESRAQAAARFARGLRHALERAEDRVLVVGHALAIRYTIDAADGLLPAARIAPVEHAMPYRLDRDALERAADLLARWSVAPRFRDPSNEG
ncbi:MAG TPA: histidine phosphatase family protein [Gaiellaceae bacterium]|nr:histidine phosphatase family protein [Gaiellaceae bacterium]